MNYLVALALFVAAAALALFALLQWLRDRRKALPLQARFEPSPDRRQFGTTPTPDTRAGHAAQRGKEQFRPHRDKPAPPPTGDDAPPFPAPPALTPQGAQEEQA
jgi:hypothetical protein